MEPLDSRPSASPGQDEGPVLFDMVPIDKTKIDNAQAGERAHPGPPADVVGGVDPTATMPLSEPQVHPPIGSGPSQLEEALRKATASAAARTAAPVRTSVTAPVQTPPPANVPPAPSAAAVPAPAPAPAPAPVNPPPAPTAAPAAPAAPAAVGPAPLVVAPAPAPSPAAASSTPPPAPPVAVAPPPPPSAVPANGAVVAAGASPLSAPAPPTAAAAAAAAPATAAAPPTAAATEESLTLPQALHAPRGESPMAAPSSRPNALPMLPVRVVGVGGTAAALTISAWQAARVLNGQERLASLSAAAFFAAVIGALGVVLWTWLVTENARRVVAPARTQEPPDPLHAAMTWIVPLVFIGGASASTTYLSSRFHSSPEGAESALPFVFALVAMILSLPMMYSPVTYLSGVVRKVGGHGIRFAEWIWVPIALAAVGAMMIVGLRFGGAFGEDFDGIAPPWVVGVAAIVPAVVIVFLGWRAGGAVESDIVRAIDRRRGVSPKTSQRRGKFTKIYADGGPNHAALRQHGFISLLPGASIGSLILSVVLGGLALLSLVGGLIMVLFWQEAREGVLLPSQAVKTWELVERLQSIDRLVILVAVGVATVWSFVAVTNVRLASARRRNPVLAAAAWPAAAGGIWIIADRLVVDGSVGQVMLGLAAQALVLAAPFLLMYRAGGSIGSRRQAIRITWAVGVILLVHVQGLGGLATATPTVDSTEIARLCGFLVIGAVLHVLLMFSAANAMRAVVDTTTQVADRHNSLIAQREQAEVSRARSTSPAPRMGDPDVSGRVEV